VNSSARRPTRQALRLLAWIAVAGLCVACGKRGAPLPPLVRVPAPPTDFTAERRGSTVKIRFTVPIANTDGSRPPNIERVDVYRFTGSPTTPDAQLLKTGTKVASVMVRAPRNPEAATEEDEPAEEPDLKEEGLDPGATTELEEDLDALASKSAEPPNKGRKKQSDHQNGDAASLHAPLTGPPPTVPSTIFVAIGVNPKGKHGPATRRVVVPLVPPPPPPASPKIAYDEHAVHLTWTRETAAVGQGEPADLLPSHLLGVPGSTISYHVYDVSPSAPSGSTAADAAPVVAQTRLTGAPVAQMQFDDTRMAWEATRCYTVRAVEAIGGLTLESEAPAPTCTTLIDTFPPAAPRDLKAVATQQAITLIWDPNNEPDLEGYFVLRASPGTEKFERLTAEPIQMPSYEDKTPSGSHFVYAVQAVDKAGNVSPLSNQADDTAR
jgi:hypothetical protein